MADQIKLTIDGIEIEANPGTNVLQAALDAGLYIPYLCYYPSTKAFGACRMCVVEFDEGGPPGAQASCTIPVTEGMVVKTKGQGIKSLRKGIMELLISEHPHGCLNCHRVDLCGPADICLRHVSVNDRCVTCPKNERCELKDTVRHLEMDLDTPLKYNNRHLPLRTADPLWEMDMNLCIVCGRCVRVCDEVRGDSALTFTDRAGRSLIGTSIGTSLLESGCEFCGACIDSCPTGALVERKHKWDKPVKTVTTICPHCPIGCNMNLEVDKRNRMIRAIPDSHAEPNHGQACFKGKFGLDFVNRKERLRKPLVKIDGVLQDSSYLDALDFVANGITQYGGDQFALISSPRSTNEDNYIAQKFARAIVGTSNIDMSSNTKPELIRPLEDMLGIGAGTNPIWELENSKCFLLVSSNITEQHNVASIPIKAAIKQDSSLIVIDPRETEITRHATMWLRPAPNTEFLVIGAMIRVIMDESLDDHDFITANCSNLKGLKDSLWDFDLVKVENLSGIPTQEIQRAARLIASSSTCSFLYAMETVCAEYRDVCVRSIVNLALVTGNIGKPSAGIYPLMPGTNEQGARDMGCLPDYLPGNVKISGIGSKKPKLPYEIDLPIRSGLSIKEMVQAIDDGHIKSMMILGNSHSFLNGDFGNFNAALKKLRFLVLIDTFRSEISDFADAILPSTTFAEKHGTYTNIERRVQLIRPALGPKGDEADEWRIIGQIANRMGGSGFDHQTAEDVFNEIRSAVGFYGGINFNRLQNQGIQWPCTNKNEEGTSILYAEDDLKAELSPLPMKNVINATSDEYPYLLAKGRLLHQSDRTMEITTDSKRNVIRRTELMELHEDDAATIGVGVGDTIEVISSQRRVQGEVRISSPHKGVISTTSLFAEVVSKLDLAEDPDPIMNIDGLPLIPVRVKKIGKTSGD